MRAAPPFATRAGASRTSKPTARGRSLRIVAAAVAVASMVWVGAPAHAAVLTARSTTTTTVPPAAKAELLVDVATGRVLLGENDHLALRPASLTKLLTAMIAYDWLPRSAEIPVSVQAATVYPDRFGMKPGQRWPGSIVLNLLLVFSANDAAYALAQRVGGSLPGFAAIMRQAAAQLGMSGPLVLRDPAGLDGSEGFEGGNLMSAWDVAIAARDLMANPALASIVAQKQYRFNSDRAVYDLASKNEYFLDSYPGAIGIKTGFTDPAGFCVAEEAVRRGRTMLAVVMNGVNSYQTAADLLNRGFAIPVSAERKDPQLPPIREPEPASSAPLAPPRAMPSVTEEHVIPDLAGAGPVATHDPGSSPVPDIVGVAVAAGLVLLTVRTIGYMRRNRRQPAASDSRSG